jgi:hypothetical protein
MPNIMDLFGKVWDAVRQGEAELRFTARIPTDQIRNDNEPPGVSFEREKHYFQMRVNELYLHTTRQWATTYDPMVFFVSEFDYRGKDKRIATPFLVGPSLIKDYGVKPPANLVLQDTRVAGLHPYRGGRLTVSVTLCQVKREDYVRKFFHMLESTAQVLDFTTALSASLKVAGVVLEGIQTLAGAGDTQSLVSVRHEFDPDGSDEVRPGYFVLVDEDERKVDPGQLFVRNRRLVAGKDIDSAVSFRQASYVLYSLIQTIPRSDYTSLPFYDQWAEVEREANEPNEKGKARAKAILSAMVLKMLQSPDLTEDHADLLEKELTDRMLALHERAVRRGSRAAGDTRKRTRLDQIRDRAGSILDL